MKRIWTSDLTNYIGHPVLLYGWLHRLRRLSSVTFLILRDGKGLAQIVIEDAALSERMASLVHESVIQVRGQVVAEPQAPGGVEIRHPEVTVLSAVEETPPLALFKPRLESQLATTLDHAPLALRHPRQRALFRLADASVRGFREALREREFVEIHTPKIVAAATESGANVFALDYFGRSAYLAQSPQQYKQMMVGVFERVYEVGPVFRAEPHDTPRHLNEYTSLDVEMGFILDHTTIMSLLTDVLRTMIETIHTHAYDAVVQLKLSLSAIADQIPAIHFAEAQELISQQTGEDVRGEPDLAPAHERLLGEWAQQEYGSDFLFVTGYPMVKRPFYTCPDPEQPAYSCSFDLLFRGLELVTGGQRLHLYQDYCRALAERGLSIEPFAGYLQAFQYGMPPHGGFAIGLERWVARLAKVANVRETTLFPRDLHRLTP